MSLYEGERTRVRVDSELSEELEVKVAMHQGSVLSPFFFAVVVDVVTEFARECALSELQYADDIVLMNEKTDGLRDKFLKWNEGITKDGISKNKIDPCEVCSLRVKANSVLCLQCDKWIHGRCAVVKRKNKITF